MKLSIINRFAVYLGVDRRSFRLFDFYADPGMCGLTVAGLAIGLEWGEGAGVY